jgi:hypothetical protein
MDTVWRNVLGGDTRNTLLLEMLAGCFLLIAGCWLATKKEYELLHSFEYSEKYDLKSGSKSVKGRLKLHSEFWENTIRANSFVLDLVKEGYKIPCTA